MDVTLNLIYLVKEQVGNICAVCVTPEDVPKIVTAGSDKYFRVSNIETGNLERVIDSGHTQRIRCLTLFGTKYSEAPLILISASMDGSIRVNEYSSGSLIFELLGHVGALCSMTVSLNNSSMPIIVSGGCDYTVRVWNLEEGQIVTVLREHEDWVTSVLLYEDGDDSFIASGGSDYMINIWNIPSYKRSFKLVGHNGAILALAFVPYNSRHTSAPLQHSVLVSAGNDKHIRVWNHRSGESLHSFIAHDNLIRSMTVIRTGVSGADGLLLVTSSEDAVMKIWRTCDLVPNPPVSVNHSYTVQPTDPKPLIYFCKHAGPVRATAVARLTSGRAAFTGLRLVSVSWDGSLALWNLEKMLRDLAWSRRKDFAYFLASCGLARNSGSVIEYSSRLASVRSSQRGSVTAAVEVFGIESLCIVICQYL